MACEGETEGHECSANPLGYLEFAYAIGPDGKPKEDVITFVLETLPKMAHKYCGDGGTLIDIGSGPVLSHSAILSKYCKNIYMAEYQKESRDLVHKWIETGEMGFDWKPYFEIIAKDEGASVKSIQDRLRSSLKDVIECDIHKPKCGIPEKFHEIQFDAVASYGALDVNSNTMAEYREALKNAIDLLKPGGILIYDDFICTEFATRTGQGEHRAEDHNGLTPTEDELKTELANAGLELIEWQTAPNLDKREYNEFLAICRKS